MNDIKAPREMSPDEVELLKKQRDLALPAARIAAYDEFAKWLFTTITVVGTLGAAFSNAAFTKLNGMGAVLFFAAISATGVSLALAVILRAVDPGDENSQDLWDMIAKGQAALRVKRRLAWGAGICFALAIVLAGMSPLASRDQSKDNAGSERVLSYSLGKDGIRVTAVLARPPRAVGELRVFASLPSGVSLLAAQRVVADQQGVMRLDVSSASVPSTSTEITVSLSCDAKDKSKRQEFVLPLQSAAHKVIPSESSSQCFE
jgi:hypothetical protein